MEKNLTLQELISHMRIKETNRLKDKMEVLSLNSSKANLMKSSSTIVINKFKGKQKKKKRWRRNKFKKIKRRYFVCGKVDDRAAQCY